MLKDMMTHRHLLMQMVKRDIAFRFRGSFLGGCWLILLPLLMLLVYGFVFIVVFEARFGEEAGPPGQFALMLFSGIVLHGFAAEILMRTPRAILDNKNLVTKVIFPLGVLPQVTVFSALFQCGIGLLVLLVGIYGVYDAVPLTALYIPLLLIPYVVLWSGIAWMLSALGVYVRDITQVSSVLVTILLFVSPVFYDIRHLPDAVQYAMHANPLTFMVMQLRDVAMLGVSPHWEGWFYYTIVSCALCFAGYYFFRKARNGFADVI